MRLVRDHDPALVAAYFADGNVPLGGRFVEPSAAVGTLDVVGVDGRRWWRRKWSSFGECPLCLPGIPQ